MQTTLTANPTDTQFGMEHDVVEDRMIAIVGDTTDRPSSGLVSLLNHIDPDLDNDDWIQTILAIHEVSGGSAEGFDLAIEWSNQSAFVRDDEFISATWGYSGDGSY